MTTAIVVAILAAWVVVAFALALIFGRMIRNADRQRVAVVEPHASAFSREPSGIAAQVD